MLPTIAASLKKHDDWMLFDALIPVIAGQYHSGHNEWAVSVLRDATRESRNKRTRVDARLLLESLAGYRWAAAEALTADVGSDDEEGSRTASAPEKPSQQHTSSLDSRPTATATFARTRQ